METVLITGGSGLVGRHLSKKLVAKGYKVTFLSRTSQPNTDIPTYVWDLDKNIVDRQAIASAHYIIHLAAANIGDKRWTTQQKQLIIDSRVKSTQLLFEATKNINKKLKAFISSSAIGYYGATTSEKIFTETDLPSNNFSGETCRQWEQSADNFETLGIRTVKIRSGIVLTKQGGALAKMATPIKLGIGSAIGNGQQYMPWIHIDDLCGIYIKAIEDTQMKGAYNAVAPEHQTNRDFMATLARALKKPFVFPNVPAVLMKLLFGEMSSIILQGSRVSSDKIWAAGYKFLFPDLSNALQDLI